MRCLCAIYVIILVFAVVGCGSVTKSIMAKQEWSENYAAAEGVEATSPLMVDGRLRTIGETETSLDSPGSTQYTEAVIKLPAEKSIRRVVIHTTNIDTFNLYAAIEDGEGWKPLAEIKNNKEKKLDLNVSVVTDQIKIKVRKTTDDERIPGGRGDRMRVRRAKGRVQEIEIYGLVQTEVDQATEETIEIEAEEEIGAPAVFVTSETLEPKTTSAKQPIPPDVPAVPGKIAEKAAPKPNAPPAIVSLKSPQSTYSLSDRIPVTIDIKIGPDDLVVLNEQAKDEMLITKLVVKAADGKRIPCSTKAPRPSPAKPYRSSGRPVEVRDARTLDADSVLTIDTPDLLRFYPITEPGTYTVQFNMRLPVYSKFVGRGQTQADDLERAIRDINTSTHYSQSEKATLISELKEQMTQVDQRKERKYIVVGTRGKSLKLISNLLELVVQ